MFWCTGKFQKCSCTACITRKAPHRSESRRPRWYKTRLRGWRVGSCNSSGRVGNSCRCLLTSELLTPFSSKDPLPSSFLTIPHHSSPTQIAIKFQGILWIGRYPTLLLGGSKISSRRRPTSSVARLVSQGSKSEIPPSPILVLYRYHLVIRGCLSKNDGYPQIIPNPCHL